MNIGIIINEYNRDRSPYTKRGLVNHLPMGQLALYEMTKNIEKVEEFSKEYIKRVENLYVKKDYKKLDSIEECLGKRELYEPCLDLVKERLKKEGKDEFVRYILNKYPLGMSSGLFHTLIRLAYAVEGASSHEELIEEVARALAYYISAYREADLFTRQVTQKDFILEMTKLEENPNIVKILDENKTLGQKLNGLYSDDYYLENGFIVKGDEEEKIRALLSLLVPTFYNSGNIVVLHCITSIHAIIMLKEYFNDFNKALDILTTTIISHLLTITKLDIEDKTGEMSQLSWNCIMGKAAESEDIHAIKLTYSGYILDSLYSVPELKLAALKRIKHN